jgi:hypothetical protein
MVPANKPVKDHGPEEIKVADRRRHNRLVVTMPVWIQEADGDAGEDPGDLGVLNNISLGGLYCQCPPSVKLKQGQILQFTISSSLPDLDLPGASRLTARGQVLRLDQVPGDDPAWGLAVCFLDELTFFSS